MTTPNQRLEELKESLASFSEKGLVDTETAINYLEKAYTQALQDVLAVLPEEIIIHAYMPSENTPENNAWNNYRNEVALRIKNLLPVTTESV